MGHLSELMQEQRARRGVPLSVLAAAVGTTKSGVCHQLSGRSMSLGMALRLGRALGILDHVTAMFWAQDRIEAEGLDCKVYVAPGKGE